MMDFGERQIRWLLAGIGGGSFALLLGLEFITEQDDITLVDFAVDALTLMLIVVAAVGTALLAQRIHAQHEERIALIGDLKVARAEGEAWRSKVHARMHGIKAEMENQFRAWRMTAAERDVGLLILKGLNHKEIAALRGTSEATVRQQAQAIYRKADLPGKTAFSAYFLEDLFAPDLRPDSPVPVTRATREDARPDVHVGQPGG